MNILFIVPYILFIIATWLLIERIKEVKFLKRENKWLEENRVIINEN